MKTKNILLIAAMCMAGNLACATFTTTLTTLSAGCSYNLQGTFEQSQSCCNGSGYGWCTLEIQNGGNWDPVAGDGYGWNCGFACTPHTFSFIISQPTHASGTYRLNMWYSHSYDCFHSSAFDPCNYWGTDGNTYPITFYTIPTTCFTINTFPGCQLCNCAALPSITGPGTTATVDFSCSTGDLYVYSYTLTEINNTNCGFIATADAGGGLVSGTTFTINNLVSGSDYNLRVTLYNHCLYTKGTASRSFHWGKSHRMESAETVIPLGEVEFYPNPARGNIQMENLPASGNLKVSLVNSLGEIINITNLFNKDFNAVNLDRYPAGIYTIVFENDAERVSKRIVLSN